MNASDVIILARRHLGKGAMDSSARLCLSDAIQLLDSGDYDSAKDRAVRSLAYSVGISHPDYQKAVR